MYALVTGASSGIGKEMAVELAKRGVNLILTARRLSRLKALGKSLADTYGCHVIVKATDLCDEAAVRALHAGCQEYDPQIVINCAGFGKMGDFVDIPLQEELEMIRTNITAVHLLTKLFACSMKRGTILNVTSIAAFAPMPLLAAYGATKAYVQSLSRAVDYEMKRRGKPIRVLTVCPPPVNTEFNAVAHAQFRMPSMSAKTCARRAIKGLFEGKSVILPGIIPKALYILSKITPSCIMLPMTYLAENAKRPNER